ncbi:MAG: 5-formyltetrahydrofolate cyclo-ligase [Lachnospiraceae bacterium]|nr:5-formyltetrahydrofolate cyclo-ligase [Lachnospiraceae bacterium]
MSEREPENRKKEKTVLRKQILNDRNALSPEQRKIWNEQILENLIRYDRENPCAVYLCYVNYKSEVSTKDFICWCLNKGKTVFVPKVFAKEKTKPTEMEFYQITAWHELKTGYQGILEPETLAERSFSEWFAKKETKAAGPEREHLRMLLPGAVFDKAGNRIGYGGGFYDRWLAKWSHLDSGDPKILEKIGLAYSMQVVETLPTERFDQKTDLVITEEFMV